MAPAMLGRLLNNTALCRGVLPYLLATATDAPFSLLCVRACLTVHQLLKDLPCVSAVSVLRPGWCYIEQHRAEEYF